MTNLNVNPINSQSNSSVKKYDTFYATVIKETASGCILELELDNNRTSLAFAYGNYNKGDRIFAMVTKTFDDNRYPRVSVESVISYAADSYYGYAA